MAQALTETGADAVNSDPDARLGRLIRKQFDFVWRLARCLGLTESEVGPAIQDVFAAAAQRIGDIRPANERAFLFSTTLHVLARVRRNRVESAQIGERAPALEELDQESQGREMLRAQLEQLPLELRVVFVLREIEQFASIEIAEIIGIPLSTVTTRLAEAEAEFATELERESDLSRSLIAAARAERAPAAAVVRALTAAGLKVAPADRGPEASSRVAADAAVNPVAASASRRSACFLAASWLALGWLVGLVVVSAVWALRDSASTSAVPASLAH